ncbi:MAG: CoA ester lyase [Proteobacteria bacterium]|nr:CoA ester lyase [Pseudomonadota bacterium]
MSERERPVRSLLFVPGNRESWMRKALGLDADALVFDLESATPSGRADEARSLVRGVLDTPRPERPLLFVRVRDARSAELEGDLEAVVCEGLSGVLLPQVIGPEDVRRLDQALGRREREAGLEPGRTLVMPLVETAQAARQAYEIALASPRIAYMGGGVSRNGDIARSLGYRWTPEGLETLFLRSKVLLDVRAAGVFNPISGLWGAVEDLEGLRAFAEQSRDLGYQGLMAIHPSHLDVIHQVFTPSGEEIDEWRRVIAELEAAEGEGRGAIRLDGRLIDHAHAETARRQLEWARKLGLI